MTFAGLDKELFTENDRQGSYWGEAVTLSIKQGAIVDQAIAIQKPGDLKAFEEFVDSLGKDRSVVLTPVKDLDLSGVKDLALETLDPLFFCEG